MFNTIKKLLQIIIGTALVAQLAGCYFDRDHWHHDNWHHEHQEDHGHDSGVDVHLHG